MCPQNSFFKTQKQFNVSSSTLEEENTARTIAALTTIRHSSAMSSKREVLICALVCDEVHTSNQL